jgi:retron-type reverse transcriptase
MSQRVRWVLDADIRSFFDSVDHEWLLRMLAHRIADPRVLRLVRMWLEAGILESDEWRETERGTPQGAGISPLLANIFLHYVLDLWVTNGVVAMLADKSALFAMPTTSSWASRTR